MKKYTMGAPNCENELPSSASEDAEDPHETSRPSQGRQKAPQRSLQEPLGRPLGSHLSTLEVLFREKLMIGCHSWAKNMSQRGRTMNKSIECPLWKTIEKPCFFCIFLGFLRSRGMHYLLFALKNGRIRSQAPVFSLFSWEIKVRKKRKPKMSSKALWKPPKSHPKGPRKRMRVSGVRSASRAEATGKTTPYLRG